MIKIMLIAGAWPNFMKIAPIARAFDNRAKEGKPESCIHFVGHGAHSHFPGLRKTYLLMP